MPVLTATTRAIALMIAAIFFFTLMDACAKALVPRVGLVPTLWARYFGQTLVVFALVAPHLRRTMQTRFPGLQLARSAALLAATGFFFSALSHIGLAEAVAIMDINPVLITLGAALFLGEKIGWRRVAGIAAALIGAMIIIRPGSDVFSPNAFFAVGAAVCYSAYALMTRHIGHREDAWTSLLYTALLGAIVLSALLPFYWRSPDPIALVLMAALAGFGTIGQLLLIRALSAGEASMLAPFAYTGLVFAMVLGLVLFGEVPDTATLVGALVIAGAGLYVWSREARARPHS